MDPPCFSKNSRRPSKTATTSSGANPIGAALARARSSHCYGNIAKSLRRPAHEILVITDHFDIVTRRRSGGNHHSPCHDNFSWIVFHLFASVLTRKVARTQKMVLVLEQPAPKFSGTAVVNGAFKEISLDSFKGKYVVLFFYPLDFTFVCPTEIIAFSDRANEFASINCQLIAASCDSQYSHLAWVNTPRNAGGLGKMQIPLLADKSASIAKDYQVYNEATGIPYRGLFIIDDKGNLRQITINDLPVGRSVDETLRLVQAFQTTDVNGEVCPANWKPGSKTINPSKSQDYFKTIE